jgi:hypothetical protein
MCCGTAAAADWKLLLLLLLLHSTGVATEQPNTS